MLTSAAIGVLAADANAAGSTWLAPVSLSAAGTGAHDAAVAMGTNGDSTVAWAQSTGGATTLQAAPRIAGPGNAFAAPQSVSGAVTLPSSAQVAEDASGDALAVWVRNGVVMSAHSPAGGSFGAPAALDGATGESDPEVAFDRAGDATAVWLRQTPFGRAVETAFAAAGSGGDFGAAQAIGTTGYAGALQLSEDSAGDAIAVWTAGGGPWGGQLEFAYSAAGSLGHFGAAAMLDPDFGRIASSPSVALDGAGDASAAWISDGPGGPALREADASRARLTAAAPAFAAAITLSSAQGPNVAPWIARDANGDTAVVWGHGAAGGPGEDDHASGDQDEGNEQPISVLADLRPAAGAFATAATLGTAVAWARPQVGLAPNGNAIALWENATHAIVASVALAGGQFGAATQISKGTSPAYDPALALDGEGDAIAAWLQGSSGHAVATAAGYDSGAGPQNLDVTIPATGSVGEPVTFSVSPFDVWAPITSTVWSFGDGSTATGDVVTHTYATAGTYSVSVTSTDADGNSATTDQTPTTGGARPNLSSPGGSSPAPGESAHIVISGATTTPTQPLPNLSHPQGATWNSGSATSSISATVTVPAVICAGAGLSGQAAGAQLFATNTSPSATILPYNFAGVYTYCNGGTPKYAAEFVVDQPGSDTLSFQPAGLSVSPGDPLELTIAANAGGSELTMTDVNTDKTATVGGAGYTGSGWEAGLTPITTAGSGPLFSGSEPISGQQSTLAGPIAASPALFATVQADGAPIGQAPGLFQTQWNGSAVTASASAISGGNQFTASAASVPQPVLGASADLAHVSGTVLIKLAGHKTFTRLTKVQRIPFGATINAIRGHVQATLRLPKGETQTGVFFDGEFKLKQSRSGATTAALTGGTFKGCPKPGAVTASVARAKPQKKTKKSKAKVVRSLWANAHGKFSTSGSYGAAAVLGTEWLTQDVCGGTYFKVTRDKIKVTVYYPHRHTVTVKQGHSLLAPAPRH